MLSFAGHHASAHGRALPHESVRASTLKKEQCTDTRNSIGYIKNSEEQRAVPHIYRYITNAISCVCALFFFKCTSPYTACFEQLERRACAALAQTGAVYAQRRQGARRPVNTGHCEPQRAADAPIFFQWHPQE